MISRTTKLRFRRRLRLGKLQVEELGQQADKQLERNFFRRLGRLTNVRRFIFSWVVFLLLLGVCVAYQSRNLGNFYQVLSPQAGGSYTEGVLGSYTNANPIYASSSVDNTVSKLVFASLFKFDDNNHLVGDLAEKYTVDERGATYTVTLRPNLKWQDGKPLTAKDVVFTFQAIQSPDAKSPLAPSWRGVTVKMVDARTVTFNLPGALVSFPNSLTVGIIPQHLLGDKPMAALRTLNFNSNGMVGSGPFAFSALEVTGDNVDNRQEQIGLVASDTYHAGRPKLDRFVVRSYRTDQSLADAFKKHEIDGAVGFTQLPDNIKKQTFENHIMPLTAQVMVFLKTSNNILSDSKIRQALLRATNEPEIAKALDHPTLPVKSPFLRGQVGYDKQFEQAGYDLQAAKQLLDAAGWKVGKSGIREKAGVPLAFGLTAQDNSEYFIVSSALREQWRAVGVDLRVDLQDAFTFQTSIANHSYDALLYGISVGVDPDVYVYWDSKQADVLAESRLNFSEYKSATADAALQAGRTRSDAVLRTIKYKPFLQAWQTDVPAIGLYQPDFLYLTRGRVAGLSDRTINAETDRFKNVDQWQVKEKFAKP